MPGIAEVTARVLKSYEYPHGGWVLVRVDRPSPMMTELASSPVAVEGGFAAVPEGPGLGIELDEDAVARCTIES